MNIVSIVPFVNSIIGFKGNGSLSSKNSFMINLILKIIFHFAYSFACFSFTILIFFLKDSNVNKFERVSNNNSFNQFPFMEPTDNFSLKIE